MIEWTTREEIKIKFKPMIKKSSTSPKCVVNNVNRYLQKQTRLPWTMDTIFSYSLRHTEITPLGVQSLRRINGT